MRTFPLSGLQLGHAKMHGRNDSQTDGGFVHLEQPRRNRHIEGAGKALISPVCGTLAAFGRLFYGAESGGSLLK